MQITLLSFGFKHGLPVDVDMVFDCRFLPNPHWVDELRPLTGLDPAVRDYVFAPTGDRGVPRAARRSARALLPAYAAEGKAYLSDRVRLHRRPAPSVAIAEEIAARLRAAGHKPTRHPPRSGASDDRRSTAPTGSWPSAEATVWPRPCGPSGGTRPTSPRSCRWPTTAVRAAGSARGCRCRRRATSADA